VKTKVSPTIVGAFVIGAFALGIIALLAFGGFNFFQKPQRFVVYFDESTHGLDQGSPVKLSGVRVGRVAALNVRYDETKKSSVVAVVCELSRDVVTDSEGAALDIGDREQLQRMIDRGLRAQLGVQGLATGLLFVELDFFDPKQYPPELRKDARYLVVPAVRSDISTFLASVTEIMTNVKKIDFGGLSRGLSGLIADARKQLEAADVKGVVEQWKKTGAQVETLANSADFKRTFDNLNGAVSDLRSAIAKLDAQVEPTSAELKATLGEAKKTFQSFNDTADATKKFIASHSGIGEDLVGTLQRLNEAADAVTRLADYLERNPSSLITGKKRPE
jgi:paraquat-inducible protein B